MLSTYSYDLDAGKLMRFGKPVTRRVSRIAWAFLHHGKLPEGRIFHLDGDKTNLKPDNLCDIDISKKPRPCRGAKWDITEQGWRVFTNKNDHMTYLGFAKTGKEARQLRAGKGKVEECKKTPAYYMREERTRLSYKISVDMIEVKMWFKQLQELEEAIADGKVLILC